jgi:BirA family biotin operon repressor/biotin-[acetyl-CoA-carboxylase] ligase
MASLPWGLIHLLADGQSHSGEVLGQRLGVSRAAVWKMIQQLEAAGLPVESIKGQGYRVPTGLDLLNPDLIQQYLPASTAVHLSQLEVLPQTTSTNTAIAGEGYSCGAVVLAELQTAGRGRRGRAWVSPLASNIYLSIRWHFTQGITCLEGLSLAVGVVLADALASLGVADIELKWPNDIWVGGKKLGGVLVEIGGDVNGDCYAIVGVGLNVAMPSESAAGIDQAWVDLTSIGYRAGRNPLAAALIDSLLQMLSSYQAKGFGAYRDDWLLRNALAGVHIETSGAQSIQGTVVGLTAGGGLIIRTAAGEQVLNGGEVSVRASV